MSLLAMIAKRSMVLVFKRPLSHNVGYQFRQDTKVFYPDRSKELKKISDAKHAAYEMTMSRYNMHKTSDSYYRLLGVHSMANPEQIRKAYMNMVKRHEEVVNKTPEVERKFMEVTNAFRVLIDPLKRSEYDEFGVVHNDEKFIKAIEKTWPVPKTKDVANVRPISRGGKNDFQLALNFIEAIHGTQKLVNVTYNITCPSCSGQYPKSGNNQKGFPCAKCSSTGIITEKSIRMLCKDCGGKRFVTKSHCDFCGSKGQVTKNTKVTVTIPSGIKNGDLVTIENPKTKERLNYRINIMGTDQFQRKGNDILSQMYISIPQAILGDTIRVKGVYEELSLYLKPGTQSHTVICLKGKGIKTRESVGDHLVTVKIKIPRDLTMKQRQLYMALAKSERCLEE